MLGIPKRDGIEKSVRIRIGQLKSPVRAAVRRLIDARFVSWPAAKQVGDAIAHRVDIAKVECLGARYGSGSPMNSAIRGPKINAARAAGPNDLRAGGAHPAQGSHRSGRMDDPGLGRRA